MSFGRQELWRSHLVLTLIGIFASLLIGRALYLTVVLEDLFAIPMAVRFTAGAYRLADALGSLEHVTSNIEKYNLDEIRKVLLDTVARSKEATEEYRALHKEWLEIQENMKRDEISHSELKKQIELAKGVRAGEVMRLRAILNEATRPSLVADIGNLALSFILGVLSSLAATGVLDWHRRRSAGANRQ